MITLNSLSDSKRNSKKRKRVGRGPGSGTGKTSGRGHKGAGSRSGYTRRHGYEGGQLPLHRKLPCRGFSNARFQKRWVCVNLRQLNELFSDGETVSEESLRAHGYISGSCHGVKILGDGELEKKLDFEVSAISASAREKLEKLGVEIKITA